MALSRTVVASRLRTLSLEANRLSNEAGTALAAVLLPSELSVLGLKEAGGFVQCDLFSLHFENFFIVKLYTP
jgi:hypothetical protein